MAISDASSPPGHSVRRALDGAAAPRLSILTEPGCCSPPRRIPAVRSRPCRPSPAVVCLAGFPVGSLAKTTLAQSVSRRRPALRVSDLASSRIALRTGPSRDASSTCSLRPVAASVLMHCPLGLAPTAAVVVKGAHTEVAVLVTVRRVVLVLARARTPATAPSHSCALPCELPWRDRAVQRAIILPVHLAGKLHAWRGCDVLLTQEQMFTAALRRGEGASCALVPALVEQDGVP